MEPKAKDLLLKTRGLAKASLTRMKTYVDKFDKDSDVINLRIRVERMPNILQAYDEAQRQLELNDEENHEKDRENFEDTYMEVLARMTGIIERGEQPSPTQTGSQSNHSFDGTAPRKMKLPDIKLPSFSGQVTEFKHFHDTFTSLVIRNDAIDDIQRYYYLLSSLCGEAHKLIENLPIIANNFNVAWEIIYKRYDNPKLIATAHIKSLLSLPTVSKDSVVDLRELINQLVSNFHAVDALQLETPLHEVLLSQLVLERMDDASRKEWEMRGSSQQFSRLDELVEFLEHRCQALELIKSNQTSRNSGTTSKHQDSTKVHKPSRQTYVTTNYRCLFCKENHFLHKCTKFARASVQQRTDFVKQNRLCYNCMQGGHRVSECKSTNCHFCGQRHHSLLHRDIRNSSTSHQQHSNGAHSSSNANNDASFHSDGNPRSNTMSYCSLKGESQTQVLLSTALIYVRDSKGKLHPCRALLDSCSQSHFVTESLVQRLSLLKRRQYTPIQGINSQMSEVRNSASLQIRSMRSPYTATIDCLVLPRISGNIPSSYVDASEWNLPAEFPLADPAFNQPGKIDILIGAEIFYNLLRQGKQVRPGPYPVMQDTEFGWILAGRFQPKEAEPSHPIPEKTFLVLKEGSLEEQLQRFWEIEDLTQPILSKEELECEQHYSKNTTRDATGRFVVCLPFKKNPAHLGDSREMAVNRLHHLERRLSRSSNLRTEYGNFLTEYEALGHMKIINELQNDPTSMYYLPHHPVAKESSTTTKTRVVFDASATTTNGRSLNDILMIGPTIQQDLQSIILRFRTHQVCFTADIEKMYRQIRVEESECRFQRILWRNSVEDPIQAFELQTVTYGTSPAPFLATRCLHQLAQDERHIFPKGAEVLLSDFYVDDCISGASTLKKALDIQTQLIQLLKKGGFLLRKWCSNHPALLSAIPPELREVKLPLQLDSINKVKTLGLLWHPATDHLQIVCGLDKCFNSKWLINPTKRVTLAAIASIFDPLGVISPVVITGKIFLQQLWLAKLNWDEEIPAELRSQWQHWYGQLPRIKEILIDRLVMEKGNLNDIQIHGFSDASEKAYGACIYCRSTNEDGSTTVKLMCSKSRVAPVKKVSLPRLELCGALLLARLLKKVSMAINTKTFKTVLWTDSTVVLAWIKALPTKWKTFVANRVAEIQEMTSSAEWRHISSEDNPADLISRGVNADILVHSKLWWNGPSWLRETPSTWPNIREAVSLEGIPEQRKEKVALLSLKFQSSDFMEKFSNLRKLQRVVAYCIRFSRNARVKLSERESGQLTIQELQHALQVCIRIGQICEYGNEIQDLEKGNLVSSKGRLRSLNPFLCKHQVLRVGGRLQNSELTFEQKHQAILPQRHHLTKLIIEDEHKRLLHAGCQLLHASVRQQYWIPNGKSVIKMVIHRCLICHKLKAETATQLMGQLPVCRVNQTRPFLNTGIDYAGPFYVKSGSPRSKLKTKCYVSVFICLATRAIHLEVVSDMTSQAFLAALKRFISRRGRCQHIYSDNGTTFVGANKELRELRATFAAAQQDESVTNFVSNERIQWHFIPPRAPHFGGGWEAGVKSFKFHLRRVMGMSSVTFEEFTTLVTEIEGCLNSRPLVALSNDPNDPSALTPGHFLIGQPITSYPEPDLQNVRLNLLSKWQQIQRQLQQFWERWSSDYLTHLQQRAKWTTPTNNIQPNTLVVLKEDNTSPMAWRLGVIEEVHPGADGLVRVVTVRTTQGTFKRPISKICPLPSEEK